MAVTPSRAATDRALASGETLFGSRWSARDVAIAPGRLELLGNHVDYNGGLVLAGAIEQSVAVASSPTAPAGELHLATIDVTSKPEPIPVAATRGWSSSDGKTGPADFARGVIAALLDRDIPLRDGLECIVTGNVPVGFGMSSSAALCVALVLAFADDDLSPTDIVTIAREGENRTGSPCGAMDQSASIAGGVILFDGRDTSFRAMEPDLGNLAFVVADSGITHSLGQSSYPTRVAESEEALRALQRMGMPTLRSLGELSPSDWATVRSRFVDRHGKIPGMRVDHVVAEVQRVREGADAVTSANWSTFGALMSASGKSSHENYDISHPVVEDLVNLMLAQEGVLGARMMGGGEGGPALALIDRDALESIQATLERRFFRHHPSHLSGDRVQVAAFGEGARLAPLA